MRVFVVGTGRCGSVTFSKACSHITNFTCAHESYCPDRSYPDNHIEVNCQYHSCMASLMLKYPDAFWVHLLRKKEDCVASLAAMNYGTEMHKWYELYPTLCFPPDNIEVTAGQFYDDVTARIRALMSLLPPSRTCVIHLENIQHQWTYFWEAIGATGNFEQSLATWSTKHNTREERGEIR